MKKKNELPEKIAVFPLSNFIIFPDTTVPLNIFEPRYIEMIDDTINDTKMIGIIQPKKNPVDSKKDLYEVGCMGRITSFNKTDDGRYLIDLSGLSRFKIIEEVPNNKLYRECKISFNEFESDMNSKKEKVDSSNIKSVFDKMQKLFEKKGYNLNWNEIKKQNLEQIINALSMASPFSLEEKQALLETKNLDLRKNKLDEILNTYAVDNFSNTTLQ
ncbi:LON peptidase substrate-binding domain-containing protein [Candidatus Pelagibacter sp.]|nr:LON peptidase substrate-binding domain-containing protein [Candidatus Pelagibacter sp.]